MGHYFKMYAVLLKLNFSRLTAYRSNFVNGLLSAIAWGLFSIFSIVFLTSQTPSVFGWKREEILLLTAVYSSLTGIFHTFLSPNFERLAQITHFGQLDRILLLPVDSQFSVSVWEINYTRLIRILIGAILFVLLLPSLKLQISVAGFAIFFILFLIGLILQYTIWFMVSTLTIWFTRLSNLTELMYSVTGMARYPREMFKQLADYVFVFLLPITLIIITPVKVLFQKASASDVFVLLTVTAGLFYLSRRFWKFALRYYGSAS
ncbi:ABC-2 family transporter protein [Candidatus Gottesmanbacteria bacterium]|nr:ABC-2 family transporter protein [Candidatus Gottesmanbacteria bacterium]